MKDKTVTVKWIPEPTDGPILDMASIRIEIDEDHPDDVWIWMLEDGEKVEGGRFNLGQFLNVVLQFYNREY
jgi:hypothetical protein